MFLLELTFAWSWGSCVNMRPKSWGTQQMLMQWTHMCDRYSCIFYLILTKYKNTVKTLKYPFSYYTLDFSKQNGIGWKLSNVTTSLHYHSCMQWFWEQKHRWNNQSGPQQLFPEKMPRKNLELILSIFKFKPMFKQHVNLLIWTCIFMHLTMG